MSTDERRQVRSSDTRSSHSSQGSHSTGRSSSSQSHSSSSRTSESRRSDRDYDERYYDDVKYDDDYEDEYYDDRRSSSGTRSSSGRSSQGRSSSSSGRTSQGRSSSGRSSQSRGSQGRSSSASHGKRPSNHKPEKKKNSALKIVLIVVEVLVLVGLGIALYFVLNTTKSGKVELPEEDIVINEEVKEKMEAVSISEDGEETASAMTGYRNIALFGVDSREGALTKNTRSDTIMIASINQETGECKLVSVFRDTYLNLGNDSYNKCNAAYAKGGPMQAINMLNMNLDLNITDFVTIGFDGLVDVIDALGGVDVNVTDAEIVHLNNYQISMVGKTTDQETYTATAGVDYTPVSSAGYQTLNGLQATAYCRIRYVGNDFQRAERQRTVIKAIMDKAKANPSKLPAIAENVFSEVYTSLDLSEIVEILGNITSYTIVDEAGFPDESMRGGGNIGSKGSCVVPLNLYDNVIWLHEFLFDEEDYEPSSAVKTYSDKILTDTAPYL